MGETLLHETVLSVTVQPKEQMTELVGEDAPEGGREDGLVDSRRVLPIPAALDGASHLFRPERHPPSAEVRVAQTMIVKIAAASADDRFFGPRKYDDRNPRGG